MSEINADKINQYLADKVIRGEYIPATEVRHAIDTYRLEIKDLRSQVNTLQKQLAEDRE